VHPKELVCFPPQTRLHGELLRHHYTSWSKTPPGCRPQRKDVCCPFNSGLVSLSSYSSRLHVLHQCTQDPNLVERIRRPETGRRRALGPRICCSDYPKDLAHVLSILQLCYLQAREKSGNRYPASLAWILGLLAFRYYAL